MCGASFWYFMAHLFSIDAASRQPGIVPPRSTVHFYLKSCLMLSTYLCPSFGGAIQVLCSIFFGKVSPPSRNANMCWSVYPLPHCITNTWIITPLLLPCTFIPIYLLLALYSSSQYIGQAFIPNHSKILSCTTLSISSTFVVPLILSCLVIRRHSSVT